MNVIHEKMQVIIYSSLLDLQTTNIYNILFLKNDNLTDNII